MFAAVGGIVSLTGEQALAARRTGQPLVHPEEPEPAAPGHRLAGKAGGLLFLGAARTGAVPVLPDLRRPPGHERQAVEGEEAYQALWAHAGQSRKSGKEIAAEHFDKLQCYIWLATPGSEAAIMEFLREVACGDTTAKKKMKVATPSAATSSKDAAGSGGVTSHAAQGKGTAMNYFS